jgi:hypothetical protein
MEGAQLHVPSYHTWTSQPPPGKAPRGQGEFSPATEDIPITISGGRPDVQEMKKEIENLVEQLKAEHEIEQLNVDRGRHQFIIGKSGISPDAFFQETGCAIIMPHGDSKTITIIGPPEQVKAARKRATELHTKMQSSNYNIADTLGNIPNADAHAKYLTQYLRQRKVLEDLEKAHQAHIVDGANQGLPGLWQIYAREWDNLSDASSELDNIVGAFPPPRMSTVNVDPFYHLHLRDDVLPKIRNQYGVHMVVPQATEPEMPVLLVFEGMESDFQVPRTKPSAADVKEFRQALTAAQKHILEIVNGQAAIVSKPIDVDPM